MDLWRTRLVAFVAGVAAGFWVGGGVMYLAMK
jgi:hypothetical protein